MRDLETLLLTHKYFVSSLTLLDRFMEYYQETGKKENEQSVRLRIISGLKKWIEFQYDALQKDKEWRQKISSFLDEMKQSGGEAAIWSKYVRDTMDKAFVEESALTLNRSASTRRLSSFANISTSQCDIYSVSVENFARQLTLMDHELYKSIPLSAFFRKSWDKNGERKIEELTSRFNILSQVIASEVVCADSRKERTQRLEHFMLLMQV